MSGRRVRDPRRALGNRLAAEERKKWAEPKWLVQPNQFWIFTRQGPRLFTVTDFFKKYDFLVASPEYGSLVGVQVSTESPESHGPPLGFRSPLFSGGTRTDLSPDDLMEDPSAFPSGVYEVYVYVRKLQSRRGAWTPDRRWWLPSKL